MKFIFFVVHPLIDIEINKLTLKITFIINHIPFVVHVPQPDACIGYGLICPLSPGQTYSTSITVPLPSDTPLVCCVSLISHFSIILFVWKNLGLKGSWKRQRNKLYKWCRQSHGFRSWVLNLKYPIRHGLIILQHHFKPNNNNNSFQTLENIIFWHSIQRRRQDSFLGWSPGH